MVLKVHAFETWMNSLSSCNHCLQHFRDRIPKPSSTWRKNECRRQRCTKKGPIGIVLALKLRILILWLSHTLQCCHIPSLPPAVLIPSLPPAALKGGDKKNKNVGSWRCRLMSASRRFRELGSGQQTLDRFSRRQRGGSVRDLVAGEGVLL